MKITFIANKDNSITFFKELASNLSKKISNLVLEERFTCFIEDVPIVALESSKESDFIFVYINSDDSAESLMLKEKLIDVELRSKTRILKVIESDTYSAAEEEDYLEFKNNLAEKYSNLIVSILFNEIEFEPKEKDFGL
jgi:hypothetical protein